MKTDNHTRPHLSLLLAALAFSILIWVVSLWFQPAGYLLYPFRIFATFIHEGSHALLTVLTGGSVQSLTVSPDGSGAVNSLSNGGVSLLLIASAGYLGTTIFGLALLLWLRLNWSSTMALRLLTILMALLTAIFGFISPLTSNFISISFYSWAFTLISGTILSLLLALAFKLLSRKWADFLLALIATQTLLSAIFDLMNVFFITAFTNAHSDAANMAVASGIPAIFWVLLWIFIATVIIFIGLRIYAYKSISAEDSLFQEN
ncbi:MAG TPA: M50 family metallopeptidase [Pyrinomonadaceae bacterium]|nr:M50 family metallopeptidase [Pyrinomonadaceae bacterium]